MLAGCGGKVALSHRWRCLPYTPLEVPPLHTAGGSGTKRANANVPNQLGREPPPKHIATCLHLTAETFARLCLLLYYSQLLRSGSSLADERAKETRQRRMMKLHFSEKETETTAFTEKWLGGEITTVGVGD